MKPASDQPAVSTVPARVRQIIKIALGLGLIVFGCLLVWPRLSEVTSTDGVINAQLVMVRAPMTGILAEVPSEPGKWVTSGDVIARIENKTPDDTTLRGISNEIILLETRQQALDGQYKRIDTLLKPAPDAKTTAISVEGELSRTFVAAQILETRQRLEVLRKLAMDEAARLNTVREAKVLAPVTGAVWRILEGVGSHAAPNGPILQMLNGKSFFVDCSVHRDDIQYVKLGTKVKVKPLASEQWLEGTVSTVLGPSSYNENIDYAVGAPRLQSNEYRVMVKLDTSDASFGTVYRLILGSRATVFFGPRTRWLDTARTLAR